MGQLINPCIAYDEYQRFINVLLPKRFDIAELLAQQPLFDVQYDTGSLNKACNLALLKYKTF